jgi:hypothetical protein
MRVLNMARNMYIFLFFYQIIFVCSLLIKFYLVLNILSYLSFRVSDL